MVEAEARFGSLDTPRLNQLLFIRQKQALPRDRMGDPYDRQMMIQNEEGQWVQVPLDGQETGALQIGWLWEHGLPGKPMPDRASDEVRLIEVELGRRNAQTDDPKKDADNSWFERYAQYMRDLAEALRKRAQGENVPLPVFIFDILEEAKVDKQGNLGIKNSAQVTASNSSDGDKAGASAVKDDKGDPKSSERSDRKIRVAVIQLNVDDNGKASRWVRVEQLLDQTIGAKLIILPELWNVGYFAFDKYQDQSEPLEGDTIRRIQRKAAELGAFVMAGSVIEKNNGRLYNTSVLIGPDGTILGTYQKMHLFGFGSDERRLLTSGERDGTICAEIASFGLSTCFDLRFPELYRRMLDKGVEMFLVASAWPHPRLEHWRILTRARAIENQSFLAAANCSGTNRGRQYCGHSVILDPTGKVLAEAGEGEEVIMADIDLDAVQSTREAFPSVSVRVLK